MQNFNHFVWNVNHYRNIYWKNKSINHVYNNKSKCHNILPTKLASLFQVQKKLKACKNSKWNFSSSSFNADDRHVKIVWLQVVISNEHVDIIQWKYLKTAFILSIAQIKQIYKFPNFRLHQIITKIDLNFS